MPERRAQFLTKHNGRMGHPLINTPLGFEFAPIFSADEDTLASLLLALKWPDRASVATELSQSTS